VNLGGVGSKGTVCSRQTAEAVSHPLVLLAPLCMGCGRGHTENGRLQTMSVVRTCPPARCRASKVRKGWFACRTPSRCTGDTGEINANFRPVDTPPNVGTAGKDAYHYLATTTTTRGEYGLFRVEMSAKAGGPKTHFHKTISESFFILNGTVRLFNGEQWIDAQQGDFLHVPQGGLHAFRNDSDAPADMLLLFTPGAPREGYFEGLSQLADATDEERARFFDKHDSYFVE
jgi:quercetin dioxygenase-like cupin family protein